MDARRTHGDGRKARPAAWAALAAAVVLLSVLPVAAQAAQRVALVIGNSEYHDPDARLINPGNDADGMAAALGRLGFKVVLGKDLDTDRFDAKIDEFAAASSGADVTLFFYAGHGLQVRGQNWLMPVNAKLEKERDLERRAVKLDAVMERMGGTKKLVFLDACRNNPLARGLARTMGLSRSEASNRGLARVKGVPGTLVVYATEAGEVASDGEGDNSPFTEALLAHIERPGLNVFAMVDEVAQSVFKATKKAQKPSIQSSPMGLGSFYLASAAVLPPPDDEDKGTAGGVTPPPSSGDAARAYEAAERAGTVAAYRIVVKHFPGTFQAELARAQIAKLEGAKGPLVVAGGDPVEEEPPAVAVPSPEVVEGNLKLSRDDRRLVQMGLAAAGHDPGPVDGVFGGRTRDALRRWQGSKRMEGTGYLTREQSEGLVALGREESERRRAEAERKAREAAERRRAEAERKAREAEERRKRAQEPGYKFRDCPGCPELVVVPGGQFGRPFAVGVYEVTFGEWDACVAGGGCGGHRPSDRGWGRGRRPVINVRWDDAKAYVRWLSRKTGEAYRLLSEAEWEYVARAGTRTNYWWGDEIGRNRANCYDCGDSYSYTAPGGSFAANSFGLNDVHGNVWEWVEDCYEGDCSRRVLRGGSWNDFPRNLRSANRSWSTTGVRGNVIGFRVVRTLTP